MNDCSMVTLMQAATPFEARTVAVILRAAGIPCHIDGDSLEDGFAASRALMGMSGTRVLVSLRDLRRAHAVVQDARAQGRTLAEADADAT